MFEKYTEASRRGIFFAREEALQLESASIESEHLLLGLLRESKDGFAGFANRPVSIEALRAAIGNPPPSPDKPASFDIPLTNESKCILAYGNEESERLNPGIIGIEHLVLGILREENSFAARFLHEQGLELKALRKSLSKAKDS